MANTAVLLVEGPDDQHVCVHLCNQYKLKLYDETIPNPDGIKIKSKGGYDQLKDSLDVELDASGLMYLGIVVDADQNLETRWISLRNKLSECKYGNLPDAPTANGLVITQQDMPTVGIWIMPDNISGKGMLEDFVSLLIPDGDVLWPYAKQCVNNIPLPENERPFSQIHLPKVYIHTWLAWKSDPGTPLGLAIKKSYLKANAPHAYTFVEWLRKVFPNC